MKNMLNILLYLSESVTGLAHVHLDNFAVLHVDSLRIRAAWSKPHISRCILQAAHLDRGPTPVLNPLGVAGPGGAAPPTTLP
eukprot:4901667-Karenia_brevis.AAC.1